MSELTLDELTLDNVSNLSEEEVSTIMSVDINKLAKEKRSQISVPHRESRHKKDFLVVNVFKSKQW